MMVPTDDGGLILLEAMYESLLEVFSKAMVESLPPHRSIDYAIDLEPGYILPAWQIEFYQSWIEWSWV